MEGAGLRLVCIRVGVIGPLFLYVCVYVVAGVCVCLEETSQRVLCVVEVDNEESDGERKMTDFSAKK